MSNSDAVALSADQAKGLALACSSAFFIGSSFIIKKKGLRVAGTNGVRAGAVTLRVQLHANMFARYLLGENALNSKQLVVLGMIPVP